MKAESGRNGGYSGPAESGGRPGTGEGQSGGARRSGLFIMGRLIGLVRPLAPVMLAAVAMGTLGYLCAIFLTVTAAAGMLELFGSSLPGAYSLFTGSVTATFALTGILAVLRGVLHYGEQECNHYIAFKLLAIIRHRVFGALRRLCPAKLEGRDRGNLISVITSDIELLEVFYAHTISPVAIAALTSLAMTAYIGSVHPLCGLLALCGYITVGAILPVLNGRRGAAAGMEYREAFGRMNGFVLDSLRGLKETIQYGQEENRFEELKKGSEELTKKQERLRRLEGDSAAAAGTAIYVFSFGMLFLAVGLFLAGEIGFEGMVLASIAMMGSFGPVTALSNLSNNLNQTLACGQRVLSILEEEPETRELSGFPEVEFSGAGLWDVSFSYGGGPGGADGEKRAGRPDRADREKPAGSRARGREAGEKILDRVTMDFPENMIVGIHGKSGSGKSTILKLLMRFWDVQGGSAQVSGTDVRSINTENLRRMESFVTQETVLFNDTIAANIAIGKPGASREEIEEAAKKASLHQWIETLPQGYDTPVGELGDSISGGEGQRIGIARAFLHGAPFLLLDEPTSNLDSLNEGIILKALKEERGKRTVVLVSHRKSTMNIADQVIQMDEGRVS